jgi:hypothetical protein
MTKIQITWKAFGDIPDSNRKVSAVKFEVPLTPEVTDEQVMDALYQDTNIYSGFFWKIIEPLLSPTRTHTALSVGDEIAIDGRQYKVAMCGFDLIEKANA